MQQRTVAAALAALALAAASILMAAPPASAAPNPNGPAVWSGNGHTYAVVRAPDITWSTAEVAAAAQLNGGPACPGHLATITSAGEEDFLVATFGTALRSKWLGASQSPSDAVATGWSWVTGEPWEFTDWAPGEPSNRSTSLGYEDALVFLGYGPAGDQMHWNDAPRAYDTYADGGYVVEFDCRSVQVDVQPGAAVGTINSDGHGVIPVAILSAPDFDAATVDPATLALDGQPVRVVGAKGAKGALEDVNGDGLLDLVVQVTNIAGTYTAGSTVATLSGRTVGGGVVTGADTIRAR